jgi:hypothetical protein
MDPVRRAGILRAGAHGALRPDAQGR